MNKASPQPQFFDPDFHRRCMRAIHSHCAVVLMLIAHGLLHAAIPTNGLVAEYDFSGNANDGIGGQNGSVSGATLTPDRFGRANSAYLFNGISNYIEIPDNDALSLTTTGSLSISVWVRPDGTSRDANNNVLFGDTESTGYVNWMGKGVTGQHEWTFRIYSADNTDNPSRVNRMSCYLFNLAGGLGAGSYVQDTIPLPAEWIHYVAVYSLSAQTVTWFKNGVQRDQDFFDLGSTHPITPENGTAPLRLGTRNFTSYFAGAIDDLRIYNRVLSQAEIQNLRDETVTPQEAWRQTYFGTVTDIGNAADLADPDGDGQTNAFEYTAGLVPTDPASRFSITIAPVPAQPTQKRIIFSPLVLAGGRSYAVKVRPDLATGTWTTLTGTTQSDNGTERTVTDLSATGLVKFYEVEINKP